VGHFDAEIACYVPPGLPKKAFLCHFMSSFIFCVFSFVFLLIHIKLEMSIKAIGGGGGVKVNF